MKLPKRIQRQRTRGWRSPPNSFSVARPSRWGNPFKGRRALERYGVWVEQMIESGELDLCQLAKYDYLSCYCPLLDKDGKPNPCHVDVILELMAGLKCPEE